MAPKPICSAYKCRSHLGFSLERHNRHGGTAKLRDAQYALTPFSPKFMGVEIGNLLSDIGKRLAYCQDAEVADWYAIDQLAPVHLHFENPY